jgi:hypothetical protein
MVLISVANMLTGMVFWGITEDPMNAVPLCLVGIWTLILANTP